MTIDGGYIERAKADYLDVLRSRFGCRRLFRIELVKGYPSIVDVDTNPPTLQDWRIHKNIGAPFHDVHRVLTDIYKLEVERAQARLAAIQLMVEEDVPDGT